MAEASEEKAWFRGSSAMTILFTPMSRWSMPARPQHQAVSCVRHQHREQNGTVR